MYSYLKDITAQGINKNVMKKYITSKRENYKDILFNNKQVYHKMKTIRSNNHKLSSYEMNNISLRCFDDKCYLPGVPIKRNIFCRA